MAWPIILRPEESESIMREARLYVEYLAEKGASAEDRWIFSRILNQIDLGITLELDEQTVLHLMLNERARLMTYRDPDFERGYFRLYGVWIVQPPYWKLERNT